MMRILGACQTGPGGGAAAARQAAARRAKHSIQAYVRAGPVSQLLQLLSDLRLGAP